jgi:hypothetical protein
MTENDPVAAIDTLAVCPARRQTASAKDAVAGGTIG